MIMFKNYVSTAYILDKVFILLLWPSCLVLYWLFLSIYESRENLSHLFFLCLEVNMAFKFVSDNDITKHPLLETTIKLYENFILSRVDLLTIACHWVFVRAGYLLVDNNHVRKKQQFLFISPDYIRRKLN